MSDTFDLTAARLIWLPITWPVLESKGDELAEVVEKTVELQVELVDLDEFRRLFISPLDEDGEPRKDAEPPATPERLEEWAKLDDAARAVRIVKDWRRIKANSVNVTFNEERLRQLLKVPGFGAALFMKAYPAAYAGMKETRSGNSEGSPATGAASDAEK